MTISRDVRLAFRLVQFAVGVALLLPLVVPWLVPADRRALVIPACEWKARYGRECAFCGMTTAFFAIRHGDWAAAIAANRGAIPIYLAVVVYEAWLLCGIIWGRGNRDAILFQLRRSG